MKNRSNYLFKVLALSGLVFGVTTFNIHANIIADITLEDGKEKKEVPITIYGEAGFEVPINIPQMSYIEDTDFNPASIPMQANTKRLSNPLMFDASIKLGFEKQFCLINKTSKGLAEFMITKEKLNIRRLFVESGCFALGIKESNFALTSTTRPARIMQLGWKRKFAGSFTVGINLEEVHGTTLYPSEAYKEKAKEATLEKKKKAMDSKKGLAGVSALLNYDLPKELGNIELSGLVRPMGFYNSDNDKNSLIIGWGANLGASFKFHNLNPSFGTLTTQVIFGQGIGQYIGDFKSIDKTEVIDVCVAKDNKLAPITVGGAHLSYEHNFTSAVCATIKGGANANIGKLLDDKIKQDDTAYKLGIYGGLGVEYKVTKQFSFGGEYAIGHRTDANEPKGAYSRKVLNLNGWVPSSFYPCPSALTTYHNLSALHPTVTCLPSYSHFEIFKFAYNMSYWSAFPFMRLTCCLIGGILWAYHTPSLTTKWVMSGVLLLTFSYYFTARLLSSKSSYLGNAWIGSLGLLGVFLSGALCLLNYQSNVAYHPLPQENLSMTAYVAVAIEDAVEKHQHTQVTMRLQHAYVAGEWQPRHEKVYLTLHGPAPSIIYGDQYLICGSPTPLPPPKNPHEFNHKAFLSYKGIFYRHFVNIQNIQKIAHCPPNQLQAICLSFRRFFETAFQQAIPNTQARSIALALVLGITDELEPEVRNTYAQTGTMHILAVSGLHVGILYFLLGTFIYRNKKPRNNSWPHALLMLAIIWTYAGITGLSPSALRATMTAGLALIAKLLRKVNNSYNLLAASAFILLLIHPLFICSVSFQLSYIAVLGILYLYPKIYYWIKCKHQLSQYFWGCTAMSLAAQIATTPISLYYFHQFPTYFILANWLVVPASFLIFVLSLSLLCTCWWPSISNNIGWLVSKLIISLHHALAYIQHLPGSTLQNMYFDQIDLGLWYIFLISIFVLLTNKKFHRLLCCFVLMLLLMGHHLQKLLSAYRQQGVIFYSIPHHRAMLFIQGKKGILLTEKALLQPEEYRKINYHIHPSQLVWGIHLDAQYTWKQSNAFPKLPLANFHDLQVVTWGQRLFIFMDTNHWTPSQQKYATDFLVLTGKKLPSLSTVQEHFQFTYLVLDTSVPKKTASQFVQEAHQQGIHCHHIVEEGALQLVSIEIAEKHLAYIFIQSLLYLIKYARATSCDSCISKEERQLQDQEKVLITKFQREFPDYYKEIEEIFSTAKRVSILEIEVKIQEFKKAILSIEHLKTELNNSGTMVTKQEVINLINKVSGTSRNIHAMFSPLKARLDQLPEDTVLPHNTIMESYSAIASTIIPPTDNAIKILENLKRQAELHGSITKAFIQKVYTRSSLPVSTYLFKGFGDRFRLFKRPIEGILIITQQYQPRLCLTILKPTLTSYLSDKILPRTYDYASAGIPTTATAFLAWPIFFKLFSTAQIHVANCSKLKPFPNRLAYICFHDFTQRFSYPGQQGMLSFQMQCTCQPYHIEVCFSPNGRCLQHIEKAIAEAQQEILVQAYHLTSTPIIKALITAHKKGVAVSILIDRSQLHKTNMIKKLLQAGIPIFQDNIPGVSHNKVMIIDENIVLTGSYNWTHQAEHNNAENLLLIYDPTVSGVYKNNWQARYKTAQRKSPLQEAICNLHTVSYLLPYSIPSDQGFITTSAAHDWRRLKTNTYMQAPSTIKNILFLDIETVPRVANYEQLSEKEQLLWAKKAALLGATDLQDISRLYSERAGIYAEFGKIIAIGTAYITEDNQEKVLTLQVGKLYNHHEGTLLQQFSCLLEEAYRQDSTRLCAHNGKEFDFPYLCRRMLVHGIKLPAILDCSGKKPWEINHLDTMEMWRFGDKKNFTSLDLLAHLFGINSSKALMDGSQVSHFYYVENDLERIATYCMQDVVVMAQIFLKLNNWPTIKETNIIFA
eukprot:gene2994-3739_t